MNKITPSIEQKETGSFWSLPDRFSILDALSLSFSFVYFTIIIAALFNTESESLLVLQSNMNLLMSTILGGYFGDQIVNRFSKQKTDRLITLNSEIEAQNSNNSETESYDNFIYEEEYK